MLVKITSIVAGATDPVLSMAAVHMPPDYEWKKHRA